MRTRRSKLQRNSRYQRKSKRGGTWENMRKVLNFSTPTPSVDFSRKDCCPDYEELYAEVMKASSLADLEDLQRGLTAAKDRRERLLRDPVPLIGP